MAKREATCPLCGAKLSAAQVLDACEDIVGEGILGCHCPFCQGYFEVMPQADRVDIGYLRHGRFDVVVSLSADGLTVLRDMATGALRVRLADRDWTFRE